MQPACQNDLFGEAGGLAGEVGEDQLRDVPGEMFIAPGLPNGCGIDQGKVPRNQFGERGFRTFRGKSAQELSVIGHLFLYTAAEPEKRTEK
jgi:hypothetical protein